MTGHVSPLPPELDRLTDGWLALQPWALSELAAAGVSLSAGTENKAALGTDPVSIAEATARLSAAGLLPQQGAEAGRDPRAAELAFFAHKYAGAPGFLAVTLSTDQGAGHVAHLDLFPAVTSAGELVLGNLLMDPFHPGAFAAVGTPAASADAVVNHVLRHGTQADNVLEYGECMILAMRARAFGGPKSTMYSMHLWKQSNLFEVTTQHGLSVSNAGKFTAPEFAGWLTRLMVETVSAQ